MSRMTRKEIKNLARRYMATRCANEDLPHWATENGIVDDNDGSIFMREIKAIGDRIARSIKP